MPSGEQAPITSTGTLPLNSVISLKNVLGVLSFKVNLMSISRVTRGLNCSVTFFSLLVYFAGLGNEDDDWFGQTTRQILLLGCLSITNTDTKFPVFSSYCNQIIFFSCHLLHRVVASPIRAFIFLSIKFYGQQFT
jgi:hypothetical protein